MSINFATLQGLTIPEGVVTQIADASGRILWSAGGGAAVLQVEKIVSNTYAAETTYENEEFILLNIYPKTNGTVNVTYGGLTKTITDTTGEAEPNAYEVFFGTFNGVTDSVATPASGKLTIEGDFYAFGCGGFNNAKIGFGAYNGITAVYSFGDVDLIQTMAFGSKVADVGCDKLKAVTIPRTIKTIGSYAFLLCKGLTSINIPSNVESILDGCFQGCHNLSSITVEDGNANYSSDGHIIFNKNKTVLHSYPTASGHYTIPSSVTSIYADAFSWTELRLTSVTIPSSVTSIGKYAFHIGTVEDKYTRTITFLSTTPPTVESYALGGNNIIVPAGCGDVYKTASDEWATYADYITEAS